MKKSAHDKFSDQDEELLGEESIKRLNNTLNKYELNVAYNDPMCEDHAKIEKIIPITYSCPKISLFIFLNFCTAFIISLCVIWFPKLRLYFFYKTVNIKSARFVAVTGTDGDLYYINLKKPTLPDLEKKNSFLYRHYTFNIPKNEKFVIFFTFKLFKYVYDPLEKAFLCIKDQIDATNEQIIQECSQGLTPIEYEHQKLIFDKCDYNIKIKSFFKLILEEIVDPFYLFQVASVILWLNYEYKLYAVIIVILTVTSILTGIFETRSNLKKIQKLARYSCTVNILRKDENSNKGIFEQKSSIELVPGDIFEVQEEGMAMPCDCLLIQGTVIVNEAMLTGESTPIIKSQIPQINNHFD